MIIQQGTNPTFDVQVVDDTGLGVTGLVAATMPTLSYRIAGANAAVSFPTLNDLALITTAYNAGGIKETSGGYYRVDGPTGIAATVNTQVRVIGEASGKHVICPPLEICPSMGVVTGGIDLPAFTAIVKELIGSGWLNSSAVTSPLTAGNWYRAGIYNSEPYWANDTNAVFAWSNTNGFTISAVVGTNGSAYFTTGAAQKVNGTWTAQGTATGTPVLTAHGNAFLGGFQPEQTLPSTTQVGTIPTTGTINTTTPPTAAAIRTEMDANSTKLANLDATVSSRLATSGYTAPTTPPTAVAIRTEMDSNSTKLTSILSVASASATSSALAADNSAILAAIASISGGGGGNATIVDVSTAGAVALRNALAALNVGVYSSTIQLPDGWLTSIVQGDDCLVTNHHSLGNFVCPDASLVGTTAYMAIRMPGITDTVTAGVSVTSSSQVLKFELPRAVTTLMKPGIGTFDVRFVDSSGNISTWIVEGQAVVYPRIG